MAPSTRGHWPSSSTRVMPSCIFAAASRTTSCGAVTSPSLLVAAGLWRRNARLNAVGLLWACFGLPIWLLYTFTGGEFMPTALLTHVGGLVIGIYGVRVLGLPRGSAWKAFAAYIGALALDPRGDAREREHQPGVPRAPWLGRSLRHLSDLLRDARRRRRLRLRDGRVCLQADSSPPSAAIV